MKKQPFGNSLSPSAPLPESVYPPLQVPCDGDRKADAPRLLHARTAGSSG